MTTMIPAWVNGSLAAVEKLEMHRLGLKHLAVSVFVLQGENILLQRRALGKYHTPGLWTNTCCTHPQWGEAAASCGLRRLREELGITGLVLDPAGQIEYRAEVGNGLTEHEVVDVFTAEAPADLAFAPDPDEVMQTRWVDRAELIAAIRATPECYTPWLRIYLEAGIAQRAAV
jgi:isopentenyl-diphosphate Delta-isomerase